MQVQELDSCEVLADNNAIRWVKNEEVILHEYIMKKLQKSKQKHNKDDVQSRDEKAC
jgi:hypothetical protein